MPSRIFLLGPNEYVQGVGVRAPIWCVTYLGERPLPWTPKHLRLCAAARIGHASRNRVRAIVMDPKDQLPGENDTDFFARMEREQAIDAYYFVIPRGCKLLGTVFEGGMLARDIRLHRIARHVEVFVQKEVAEVDIDTERWIFREKGNRTRYLTDLAAAARNVQSWATEEDLMDILENRALQDL